MVCYSVMSAIWWWSNELLGSSQVKNECSLLTCHQIKHELEEKLPVFLFVQETQAKGASKHKPPVWKNTGLYLSKYSTFNTALDATHLNQQGFLNGHYFVCFSFNCGRNLRRDIISPFYFNRSPIGISFFFVAFFPFDGKTWYLLAFLPVRCLPKNCSIRNCCQPDFGERLCIQGILLVLYICFMICSKKYCPFKKEPKKESACKENWSLLHVCVKHIDLSCAFRRWQFQIIGDCLCVYKLTLCFQRRSVQFGKLVL